jgi:hypothetical protein
MSTRPMLTLALLLSNDILGSGLLSFVNELLYIVLYIHTYVLVQGPLSFVSTTEYLFERKSKGSGLENRE